MTDVLIVEDVDAMQMVYEGLVRKTGLSTATANTVLAAKKLFAQRQPKVVMLDLGLPDGDGLQLMQYMLEQRPEARIIVITADGSMKRVVEAMRLGALDFLVKPVAEQRLLATVDVAMTSAIEAEAAKQGEAPEPIPTMLKDEASIKRLVGLPLDKVERALIEATIEHCNGSLPKAAEMLALAPSTLYRKKDGWDK